MTGERLLIGNSTQPGEGYLDHCADALVAHFAGRQSLLFVPYALADVGAYADLAVGRFARIGLHLRSIHRADDPSRAIAAADGIFVGGGNTFRLLRRARQLGILESIRRQVLAGARYAGASAGSNLACPTIKTTNDMPIVDPGGLDALGLVGFQVNPHYVDRDPDVAHGGETREQRIAEFHEENATPVLGLREGTIASVREGEVTVSGRRGCRLFLRGEEPREITAGTALEALAVYANIWPAPTRPGETL